ncbi:hypothetical protein B7494_g4533 [Chlorociboria aeruginascens]|nr:hypothetical protein B7494_g4533 [Chlorociboria aeruginascens]
MSAFPHAWKAGHLPTGTASRRSSSPRFDALRSTAHELQDLLTAGTLTSTDLVEEYVWRIEQYNTFLNAVSQYAPGVMKRAQELDSERKNGNFLGPLHGIPIILKDNIATDKTFGMSTTAGCASLWNAVPARNATIVDKLQEAGAIILGKATMSELGGHKGNLPVGWSSVAGMANSAYVRGGFDHNDSVVGHTSTSGSSSGPCVAVSAGFGAWAIGTDTEGSLISPAARAAVYSMRPTTGIVPVKGIVPLAHSMDTAGPVAKDVLDLANALTAIVDPTKTTVPVGGYQSVLGGSWEDIRVGTLDVRSWLYPDGMVKSTPETIEQILRETNAAYEKIGQLAAAYHRDVDLRSYTDFQSPEHLVVAAFNAEFKDDLDDYLATLEESEVRTMKEMVEWNEKNPAEIPNQSALLGALNATVPQEKADENLKQFAEVGSDFLKKLDQYNLDVIIGPGDSFFTTFSAANRCPLAAMPLSTLDCTGRPFGLMAMARPHQEALLLKVMSAFESTFPKRPIPEAFLAEGLEKAKY